jgi:hypothetical protein
MKMGHFSQIITSGPPIRKSAGDLMTPPTPHYEASDTLCISFTPGEQETGIELTEHIRLRSNTGARRAVGLVSNAD